jgi:hypothetical protein
VAASNTIPFTAATVSSNYATAASVNDRPPVTNCLAAQRVLNLRVPARWAAP